MILFDYLKNSLFLPFLFYIFIYYLIFLLFVLKKKKKKKKKKPVIESLIVLDNVGKKLILLVIFSLLID